MAITARGLALGVRDVSDQLLGPVFALLSGLLAIVLYTVMALLWRGAVRP
jgi:hypothetical protein